MLARSASSSQRKRPHPEVRPLAFGPVSCRLVARGSRPAHAHPKEGNEPPAKYPVVPCGGNGAHGPHLGHPQRQIMVGNLAVNDSRKTALQLFAAALLCAIGTTLLSLWFFRFYADIDDGRSPHSLFVVVASVFVIAAGPRLVASFTAKHLAYLSLIGIFVGAFLAVAVPAWAPVGSGVTAIAGTFLEIFVYKSLLSLSNATMRKVFVTATVGGIFAGSALPLDAPTALFAAIGVHGPRRRPGRLPPRPRPGDERGPRRPLGARSPADHPARSAGRGPHRAGLRGPPRLGQRRALGARTHRGSLPRRPGPVVAERHRPRRYEPYIPHPLPRSHFRRRVRHAPVRRLRRRSGGVRGNRPGHYRVDGHHRRRARSGHLRRSPVLHHHGRRLPAAHRAPRPSST